LRRYASVYVSVPIHPLTHRPINPLIHGAGYLQFRAIGYRSGGRNLRIYAGACPYRLTPITFALIVVRTCMGMCACVADAQTHRHTDTQTHVHLCKCTRAHVHTCTRAHAYTRIHARKRTYTYTHTHTHTHTYTHKHTHKHIDRHTHKHMLTRTHIHTHADYVYTGSGARPAWVCLYTN